MRLKKSSGCVLDLRMDEGSGSTAGDSSRYGNDGALNGCRWVEDGLEFNGSSDYVDCGNGSSLDITDAITIAVWANPAVTTNAHLVMAGKSGTTFNLFRSRSGLAPGDALKVGWHVAGTYLYGNVDLTQDIWWHVVATYDKDAGSNNKKIYVNGVLDDQTTQVGAIPSEPTNDVDIGRTLGWGETFNGILDQPRIHNRALTASEIRKQYDASKHKYL